jgi:hypothetical protein
LLDNWEDGNKAKKRISWTGPGGAAGGPSALESRQQMDCQPRMNMNRFEMLGWDTTIALNKRISNHGYKMAPAMANHRSGSAWQQATIDVMR